MTLVKITIGDIIVTATLDDSSTARVLQDALPFESAAQRWGEEVYFETPVEADEKNSQADVPSGTVAYWPPGKAPCLFFGQKPYSPVNVVGRVEGDAKILKGVSEGDTVRVERA